VSLIRCQDFILYLAMGLMKREENHDPTIEKRTRWLIHNYSRRKLATLLPRANCYPVTVVFEFLRERTC
jgi:hypothetical protein